MDENIRIKLSADNSDAIKKIQQTERAINKLDNAVKKVDVRVTGLQQAERDAAKLYRMLERLESAALSKLPRNVQMVIAYLKAASQTAQELGGRFAFAGASAAKISAPLQIVQTKTEALYNSLKLVNRELLISFEAYKRIQAQFSKQRQLALPPARPLNEILDVLIRVQQRGDAAAQSVQRLFDTIARAGNPGGFLPPVQGPPGRRPALPPGRPGGALALSDPFNVPPIYERGQAANQRSQQGLDINSIRGLQEASRYFQQLVDTAEIGSAAFQNASRGLNNINQRLTEAVAASQAAGAPQGSLNALYAEIAARRAVLLNTNMNTEAFNRLSLELNDLEGAARRAERSISGRQTLRNRLGTAANSAILGGGFPLLFGGPSFSAAGGGLGGFAGGLFSQGAGFAGGIAGSALGAAIDKFLQGLNKLAEGLDSTEGILEGLAEAGFNVSKSLKESVKTLEEQGRLVAAYDVAIGELERRFGPNAVQELSNYNAANQKLKEAFSDAASALQRELLPALTLITRTVAGLIDLINRSKPILDFLVFATPGGAGVQELAGAAQAGARNITTSPTNAFGFQDPGKDRRAIAAKEALGDEQKRAAIVNQINQASKAAADKRAKAAREQLAYEKEMLRIAAERTRLQLSTAEKLIALQTEQITNANKLKIAQAQAAITERDARREILESTLSLIEAGQQSPIQGIQDATSTEVLDTLLEITKLDIEDKVAKLGFELIKTGASMERINAFTAKYRDTLIAAAVAANELKKQQERLRDLDAAQDTTRSETAQRTQLADSADALARSELQLANPFGGDAYEAEIQYLDQIKELRDIQLKQQEQALQLQRERVAAITPEEKERIDQKIKNQDAVNKKIREEALARQAVERSILKQQQVLEKLQPVTDALASGITDFFTSVIDGSKSAEEAFSDMLKGMAAALAQQAAIMIAQYIALGIARIFATGGNNSAAEAFTPQLDLGLGTSIRPTPRADGGPVNQNTPYIVGEEGPEYFIPGVSGTIVSNDVAFGDAADAMTGASRAFAESSEALAMATATRSANTAAAAEASAMQSAEQYFTQNKSTVNFDTYRVGEMDVVTREDAMKIGMESAKQAEANVYRSLRNMPAVRGRTGVK